MLKLIAFGLLMFMTCAFGPFEPTPVSSSPMTAPAHYRDIWLTAEACTGKEGNFNRVDWHEVPGNEFSTPTGAAIGWWNGEHGIWIAHDWKTTDWVVKHEMVHELTRLKHDGTGSKPGPRDTLVWGKRCAAMWGFQPRDTTYVP